MIGIVTCIISTMLADRVGGVAHQVQDKNWRGCSWSSNMLGEVLSEDAETGHGSHMSARKCVVITFPVHAGPVGFDGRAV